jgi:uncharacterized protein (TIGR02147 family)
MKKIFEYTNYRQYLADFFEESKKSDPKFSHRYLAAKLGLVTPNLFWLIIKGKRNLSRSMSARLVKYLRLTKRRANYFIAMVGFLQAKKHEEKDRFFSRMIEMRKPFHIARLDAQHYEYYSTWYNPVIRELVTYPDFNGDFRAMGLKVSPPVSELQARNSVELLLRLGMLRKKNGRYVQTDPVVSTGPEVNSLAVINFHRQMSYLAASSYDRCKRDQHNISSVTMNISNNKFKQLVRETNDFRRRVMALQDPGGKNTKVYHINIQVFPVTRVPSKRWHKRKK